MLLINDKVPLTDILRAVNRARKSCYGNFFGGQQIRLDTNIIHFPHPSTPGYSLGRGGGRSAYFIIPMHVHQVIMFSPLVGLLKSPGFKTLANF